ncbi:MAG: hypothetical protein WBB45_03580 [Cyclobacteriaceae bacterium]
MNDDELLDLWKAGGKTSQKYYEHIRPEIMEKANTQSNDILNKVRKNIIAETIASVVVAIIMPFFFYHNTAFFFTMLVATAAALAYSLYINRNYLRRIRSVNTHNIIEGLKSRIEILSDYVSRIKRSLYILTPVGFYLGFAFAISEEGAFNAQRFSVLVVATSPALFLILWLGKRYIGRLYGRHLTSLQKTAKQFQ